MKRFLKWALISLIALLVLVVAAAILLPRIYRDAIRVDLEKEIDQQVDADVTFRMADLRLLRHFPNLTLSLSDLLGIGKNEFKSDTLASVQELQLEVNLWSLVAKREIEIKSVNLLDPEINIYVLKDGKANYDIAKSGNDSYLKEKSVLINDA